MLLFDRLHAYAPRPKRITVSWVIFLYNLLNQCSIIFWHAFISYSHDPFLSRCLGMSKDCTNRADYRTRYYMFLFIEFLVLKFMIVFWILKGLDPAGPYFYNEHAEVRLDKSDAKFVDAIHTEAGGFGMENRSGHIDFYPNGGRKQRGCPQGMSTILGGKNLLIYLCILKTIHNLALNTFW